VRNAAGKRLYGEEDMRKAKLISQLLDYGQGISDLANSSSKELESMLNSLRGAEPVGQLIKGAKTKMLIKYLGEFHIDGVAKELQYLRQSVGVKDFIFSIVLPVMREIGVLVFKEKYSVTQEHIISTIIRDQVLQIYLPNLGTKDREVALATPDGNLHELSIIFADLLCRANRISTRYLGASHPAKCLAEALNALQAPNLVLGTLSSDGWDYKASIINYLQQIDAQLNYPLRVVLGGGLSMDFPNFRMIKNVVIAPSFESFDKWLEEEC
jgi:methanogenic corrinoid protein MtbC1